MDTTRERTVSGRGLVIVGLVVALLVTGASIVFGPGLREDVRQEQSPRTLREPIASGTHQGDAWEAVGRYDGEANCVELRFRSDVLGRACDTGDPNQRTTQLPGDGPTVAYGVASEDATRITLKLDDGTSVTAPVVAGELGFPVGFYGVNLPEGTAVRNSFETIITP